MHITDTESFGMNKVILIVLLVCIVSLISSISPPKLPVTFYTNVKMFGNVTQNPITGLIANDNAKQLYVFNLKDSHGNSAKTPYRYFGDPTNCTCFNDTYKIL